MTDQTMEMPIPQSHHPGEELTDEQLRKAEDLLLFPQLHTKTVTLSDGIEIKLRPLPLSLSKVIKKHTEPLIADFQQGLQKGEQTNQSFDITQVIDIVAVAAKELFNYYAVSGRKDWTVEQIEQQYSADDVFALVGGQVVINGYNDFLLFALRGIMLTVFQTKHLVTSQLRQFFSNPSVSVGTQT